MGKWLGEWQLFKVPECDIEFYVYCFFVWNKSTSLHKPTLSSSFLHTNIVTLVLKPVKEVGTPSPACHLRQVRRLRWSSTRLRDSTRSIIRRYWTWGRTRNVGSRPSSRLSRRTKELFRSWMDWEIRAGGTSSVPALPAHVPLTKMGPQDDPEAFIDLFERTAEACGWPQVNWPVSLIPLL